MFDVFLPSLWTLVILTWVTSLSVAQPTGASPNPSLARASDNAPNASGIQAGSVLRSAHVTHYPANRVATVSPPKIKWNLAGGETIQFFAYESIYDPPSANFYTALISATKEIGQDCANIMLPLRGTCLKQEMTEKTVEFNDYSVWLAIENPDLKLTFGTLLLSLEAIGQFYLRTGKVGTHFQVYKDDPVYGGLGSGWIGKSVGNSGGNGTLPNSQGAIGNSTDGDASVVPLGVDTA